jgi:hypothetical protein
MKTIVRLLMMAAIGFGIPVRSQAQTYPAKPIKIIVPSPGGATTDTLAMIYLWPLAAIAIIYFVYRAFGIRPELLAYIAALIGVFAVAIVWWWHTRRAS